MPACNSTVSHSAAAGRQSSAGAALTLRQARSSGSQNLARHLRSQQQWAVSDSTVYRLIKYLPESVRMMLGILDNVARLQKLIAACGGTTICIPTRQPGPDHPLVKILGQRGLKAFMAAYGGTDLYIPRCTDFLRQLRNAEITRAYGRLQKQGCSARAAMHALCADYALSKSRIWAILNTIPNS